MSWRLVAALVACFGIVACGGGGNPLGNGNDCRANPFDPPKPCDDGSGGGGGGTTPVIPAALKGNLDSVTYDKAAGTLTAVINPLDASPVTVTFVRDATLDIGGYQAFRYQETTSNRYFLALFDTSADGAVSGGVTGSGQFTKMVWGSTYQANTAFAAPTAGGLATYTGGYAGILNSGATVPGPGNPFDPIRPARVTGEVQLNADFTNNAVEGGIRNRQIANSAIPLDDLFLIITEIDANGRFTGTVEDIEQQSRGTYGGAFGGNGATAVAGAIEVRPDQSNSDLLERGVFVLDRCVPGDPAPCPQ